MLFAIMSQKDYTCSMKLSDDFASILKENSVSVTSARRAIFQTLLDSDEPLKNGEVARRTPTVDRASVYRTLELFSKLGVTTTIVRGWTPFTELAEPFKAHHHHITCEQCGKIVEIENSTLEDVLSLIASRYDFTLTSHTVELAGLCIDCRAAQAL